jgi:acyl carrier protein
MAGTLNELGIRTLLCELLAEILELPIEAVDAEVDLVDELDADSLQRLELMTMVERRLGIRFDAAEWRDARTVAELADFTACKLGLSPR